MPVETETYKALALTYRPRSLTGESTHSSSPKYLTSATISTLENRMYSTPIPNPLMTTPSQMWLHFDLEVYCRRRHHHRKIYTQALISSTPHISILFAITGCCTPMATKEWYQPEFALHTYWGSSRLHGSWDIQCARVQTLSNGYSCPLIADSAVLSTSPPPYGIWIELSL